MSARILLTSTVHWPSTARLVGAFAKVGARVAALLPAGHMAAQSRFLAERHFYDPLLASSSLRKAIVAARPDIVIPCDDRALRQLLRIKDKVLLQHSLGEPRNYSMLTARSELIAAAQAIGIEAPATIAVASEDELDAQFARLGVPCVLKVDGSWGGDGVAILHSREQARAAWRKLATAPARARSVARAVLRHDAHFLAEAVAPSPIHASLQAFVPGMPATSAFACWKGRVLGAIHMDVLEVLHARGPATVMRRVECRAMEQAAIRIAERFGLSGLHGLDFIRDRHGTPHLIEMNPRATQTSAFAFGPGRDLAAALVAEVAATLPAPRPLVTENPVIALFPQEWRRDPQSGWLHSAYTDVPWDDPAVLRACLAPGEESPERRLATRSTALTLHQVVGR